MHKIYLSLLFVITLFTATNLSAQKQRTTLDKIVAVVGNKIILQSELEVLYLQSQQQNPALPESYKCDILQQKIFEKMLITQAQRDSLNVNEAEVESNLERRIRYFTQMLGGKEKFEQYYHKTVDEVKDQFRDEIRDQMYAQQMQSSIVAGIKISPSEVKKYFDKYSADSLPVFPASAEVLEIVKYPKVSRTQDSIALSKIQKIKQDILAGADFSSKAIVYSQDPGSAKTGGDLGEVERGVFVPEFEAVAFQLRDGEMSEPVKTQYGYHLIKMIKNYGNKIKVAHILIKANITADEQIATINLLDSLKQAINNKKITFEDAVRKYSDEEQSKSLNGIITDPQTGSTRYELQNMDADMSKQVKTLDYNQASEPLVITQQNGEQAFRIITIRKMIPEHKANLQDDYNRIAEVAQQDKQQDALETWTQDNLHNFYLYIDPEYTDCESLRVFKK